MDHEIHDQLKRAQRRQSIKHHPEKAFIAFSQSAEGEVFPGEGEYLSPIQENEEREEENTALERQIERALQ
jgi:hypothetical protein